MRYKTNVAIIYKGDRINRGDEVELTSEEAAALGDDVKPVEAPALEESKVVLADVSLEDMSYAQLKERAGELDLSKGGSKADLQERISLHLADNIEA